MILVVGGHGQGKRDYVLSALGVGEEQVGCRPQEGKPVLDRLEQWLRTEEEPMAALEDWLEGQPAGVILCDEVGCGVVPMDREERRWRERVGRTCCALAQRAEVVLRISCGLPMTLKGKNPWN